MILPPAGSMSPKGHGQAQAQALQCLEFFQLDLGAELDLVGAIDVVYRQNDQRGNSRITCKDVRNAPTPLLNPIRKQERRLSAPFWVCKAVPLPVQRRHRSRYR